MKTKSATREKTKYWQLNCQKCNRRTIHVKTKENFICLTCKSKVPTMINVRTPEEEK